MGIITPKGLSAYGFLFRIDSTETIDNTDPYIDFNGTSVLKNIEHPADDTIRFVEPGDYSIIYEIKGVFSSSNFLGFIIEHNGNEVAYSWKAPNAPIIGQLILPDVNINDTVRVKAKFGDSGGSVTYGGFAGIDTVIASLKIEKIG